MSTNDELQKRMAEQMEFVLSQTPEALAAENAKLQNENARLRSCLSDDAENARMIMAENAKLRELVRILYYCGLPWKDCDKCAMNGAEMHVKISEIEFCDGMYERMRELGIEVDE